MPAQKNALKEEIESENKIRQLITEATRELEKTGIEYKSVTSEAIETAKNLLLDAINRLEEIRTHIDEATDRMQIIAQTTNESQQRLSGVVTNGLLETDKKLDAKFGALDQQIQVNTKEILDTSKIQISKVNQIATLALISAAISAVIGLTILLTK